MLGRNRSSEKRDFIARNVEFSRRKSTVTSTKTSSASSQCNSRDRLLIQSRFSRHSTCKSETAGTSIGNQTIPEWPIKSSVCLITVSHLIWEQDHGLDVMTEAGC